HEVGLCRGNQIKRQLKLHSPTWLRDIPGIGREGMQSKGGHALPQSPLEHDARGFGKLQARESFEQRRQLIELVRREFRRGAIARHRRVFVLRSMVLVCAQRSDLGGGLSVNRSDSEISSNSLTSIKKHNPSSFESTPRMPR